MSIDLRELEAAVNQRLALLDPRYAIVNLKCGLGGRMCTLDGTHTFDFVVGIDPGHFPEMREIFREVLGRDHQCEQR